MPHSPYTPCAFNPRMLSRGVRVVFSGNSDSYRVGYPNYYYIRVPDNFRVPDNILVSHNIRVPEISGIQ